MANLPPGVTRGTAGPATLSSDVIQQKNIEQESNAMQPVEPRIKSSTGKTLLPFNITPPRITVSYNF